MIKMGEAFSEAELEMYSVQRYTTAKKEWIKWKKMMEAVSMSDMRMNTMLDLVFYKIFEDNGLWDQGRKWEMAEMEAMKTFINQKRVWDFNMKMPEQCMETNCAKISAWFRPRGVSNDAADMANWRMPDEKNVTLKDIDTNLDALKKYEDAMTANSTV